MSQDQQDIVIDRALEQLSDPALQKSRAARRLQETLVGAKKSGKLPVDDLRRATTDFVEEVDVPRYFAKDSDGSANTNSGLAILFLLVLLTVLLALAGDDSDLGALLRELIEMLLDLLRGGGTGV